MLGSELDNETTASLPFANISAAMLPASNSASARTVIATVKSNDHSAPSSSPTTALLSVNSPYCGGIGVGVDVGVGTRREMKCHSPPFPVILLHTRFPSPVVAIYVSAIGAITVARILSDSIVRFVVCGIFQITFSAISAFDKLPTIFTLYRGIVNVAAFVLNTTVWLSLMDNFIPPFAIPAKLIVSKLIYTVESASPVTSIA